jgi:hypothetical protein
MRQSRLSLRLLITRFCGIATGRRRDERRKAIWECEARRRFAVASGPPASALRRRRLFTFECFPEMNVRVRPLNLPNSDHPSGAVWRAVSDA